MRHYWEKRGRLIDTLFRLYETGDVLAACCACGFFALDAAKNPRLLGCAYLWYERSLQGKKSPDRRFFGISRAKRNKLLAEEFRVLALMSGCLARAFTAIARKFTAKTREFRAKARRFAAKARKPTAKTRKSTAKARDFTATAVRSKNVQTTAF